MADSNLYGLTTVQATLDSTSQLYAVTGTVGSYADTRLPVTVILNNTVLTGTPTVPGYLTSATAAATYAPLASPVFTGSITGGSASISLGGSASFASIQSTPIGTTAAAAGGFTTLTNSGAFTVNGSISGPGITTLFTSPAFTGTFTAVAGTYTGLITPSTTVGIKGTTAADNAQAGSVGEYLTASGSGVALTTATVANATSLSLTAGDWDVTGVIQFNAGATTTASIYAAGISTTSVTRPVFSQESLVENSTVTGNSSQQIPTPVVRINVSTTTTVYLTAFCSFATSTMTANSLISARRVR